MVIINVVVIFVFLATKFYYVAKNKSRDKKWKALTAEVRHIVVRQYINTSNLMI